jgi:hypothetical protein
MRVLVLLDRHYQRSSTAAVHMLNNAERIQKS